MGSNLFSILTRLSSNLKSKSQLSENLFETAFTRSLYTKTLFRNSLYVKISQLRSSTRSLVPELDKWVEKGNEVQVEVLKRIIRDLRKHKRYTQALEVSEWMGNKGIHVFSTSDHAVQLDLIDRVRGLESAEGYFNNISDQYKLDRTYGTLLSCYVRAQQTNKSLSHMKKMKEMGYASSPSNYKDIMLLYTNLGEYEKVPDVFTEMKENGILPDSFSYKLYIQSYGARSNIDGMEQALQEMETRYPKLMDWNTYTMVANYYIKSDLTDKAVEMLKKAEEKLDKEDGLGYTHINSLYATLGNKTQVMRIWELQKAGCKRILNRDYITMLSSLLKLGELEKAEKLLLEWLSSGNRFDFRVPNVLLIWYSKAHMVEKAEALLNDLVEKGKSPIPNSWGIVAAGYVNEAEMESAVECMKKAFALLVGNEGWRPNPNAIASILHWLGDKGEVEEVEAFVGSLKTVIPMNRDMYHALLKASMRGGKEVDKLLESMKSDEIDGNEETKKILSAIQDHAK